MPRAAGALLAFAMCTQPWLVIQICHHDHQMQVYSRCFVALVDYEQKAAIQRSFRNDKTGCHPLLCDKKIKCYSKNKCLIALIFFMIQKCKLVK